MESSLKTLIWNRLDKQHIEFMAENIDKGILKYSGQGVFYRLFVIVNGREMTVKEAAQLDISRASYYRHKKEYAAENPIVGLEVVKAQDNDANDDLTSPFI